jgi:hypothetical protein
MFLTEMKKIIKKSKILYPCARLARKIQYGVAKPFLFSFFASLRKIGIYSLPIKKMKNCYEGKRCFIVATGPSLTKEDLCLIKNEYTFGMNSVCKIFDELGWETTFFGVQDYNVYGSLIPEINNISKSICFFGSNLRERYKINKGYIYPLDMLNHALHPSDCYKTDFSDDCSIRVYDGYSVTYSIIQLAVYLGFKEIILLGCDCGYTGKKHHFIEHGVIDPFFSTAQERMFFSYRYAKQYADKHNVKIYNATRGGALEIFPRVDLDEIL